MYVKNTESSFLHVKYKFLKRIDISLYIESLISVSKSVFFYPIYWYFRYLDILLPSAHVTRSAVIDNNERDITLLHYWLKSRCLVAHFVNCKWSTGKWTSAKYFMFVHYLSSNCLWNFHVHNLLFSAHLWKCYLWYFLFLP